MTSNVSIMIVSMLVSPCLVGYNGWAPRVAIHFGNYMTDLDYQIRVRKNPYRGPPLVPFALAP